MAAVIVHQLRNQLESCKSAEDWLNVTRVWEAKLRTTSAANRCERLSPLYCQAFQVVSKLIFVKQDLWLSMGDTLWDLSSNLKIRALHWPIVCMSRHIYICRFYNEQKLISLKLSTDKGDIHSSKTAILPGLMTEYR